MELLQFNVFELLAFAFLLQALLYLIFLMVSPKSLSEYLLMTLITILVILIINLFIKNRFAADFPYLYFEFISMIAPIQYFYVQSLVSPDFQPNKKSWIHFLTFGLILLLHGVFLLLNLEIRFYEQMVAIPVFLVSYYYLQLSFSHLHRYHSILLLTRSNVKRFDLEWLKIELLILIFFFLTLGIESVSFYFDLGWIYPFVILLSFLSLLLFIGILTFKSLRFPYYSPNITEQEEEVLQAQKIKYANSKISISESKALFEELYKLVKEQKLYKEFGFSLSQLAQLMNLNQSETSRIINENAKINFNDFINQFRVKEAKQLLQQHPDWLIKEVMYESGFQSTSTFNSVFKKVTGKSPSSFR